MFTGGLGRSAGEYSIPSSWATRFAVGGMICMSPTAAAGETAVVRNPLSWRKMA